MENLAFFIVDGLAGHIIVTMPVTQLHCSIGILGARARIDPGLT
ncbi:hypothetical protein [Xanthomonas campestris]|nr:hypothetical protein [Xanthomonas campestris]